MNHSKQISYRYLPAHPIIPKDDTFHGSKHLLDIEWWYFDAVFDNGLSVHIGFRIYHIRGVGLLQIRVNLYKDGELIKERLDRYLLSNIIIDNNEPSIIINDKKILSFYIKNDNNLNKWNYIINETIRDVGLKLSFTGLTEGWKIETKSTCWTVPLPNAEVNGTITIGDKTISVKGRGYHDHNWGYSPATVIQNLGWYWGRISSNMLHITWANTISSETKQDLITVVNKPYKQNNEKTFFNSIHPNNIKFTTTNFKKYNKISIPYSFKISFLQPLDTSGNLMKGNIKMDTIAIHYDRIFIINYWRYHVQVSGKIQYGDISETIEKKPQIIEYLKF
jgi:predicted secreted hydrolase